MDDQEKEKILKLARIRLVESWDKQIKKFEELKLEAQDKKLKEIFDKSREQAIQKKLVYLQKFDNVSKTKTKQKTFTVDAILVTEEEAKKQQLEIDKITNEQLLKKINSMQQTLNEVQNDTSEIKQGKISTRTKIWIIGGWLASSALSVFLTWMFLS